MLNIKKYVERRNAIITEMEELLNSCEEETRAFNEEEKTDTWREAALSFRGAWGIWWN